MTDYPGFACDMEAIPPEERPRHMENMRTLFQATEQIKELANGYAFKVNDSAEVLVAAIHFIAKEKLCCPFLEIDLRVDLASPERWLRVRGPDGVKPFIHAEFYDVVPATIEWAPGFLPFAPAKKRSSRTDPR